MMIMNKSERNSTYSFWFYLFLGSFLFGVLIMNMGNETLLSEGGIFSQTSVGRLRYMEIDSGRFFRYVLEHRMGEGALLLLLSSTGLGVISIYACIIWQGILTGMTITAAVIRYGIKGLLLLLGSLFPHQLLLIPAEVMLLGWCYENCSKGHFLGKYTAPYHKNIRQQYLKQAVGLLWIVIVIFIGCILESYVNPILLSDLVKIF
ncbi:stage II sporulation protein M [Parablautia muri]|uniref:Stage II sporulation protein M n=1 Tax=Parablautia muri TaxID=2320879 RepID=A0A9X5BHJ1_9FIRM|nr:stage II sporulation protein M [Parablautia muri]NBJ93809.1 stage II sporulation protein M [Parablautia muri]